MDDMVSFKATMRGQIKWQQQASKLGTSSLGTTSLATTQLLCFQTFYYIDRRVVISLPNSSKRRSDQQSLFLERRAVDVPVIGRLF